jgi:hypothetical protein
LIRSGKGYGDPWRDAETVCEFFVGPDHYVFKLRDGGEGVQCRGFKNKQTLTSRIFSPMIDASRPSRDLAKSWAIEQQRRIEQQRPSGPFGDLQKLFDNYVQRRKVDLHGNFRSERDRTTAVEARTRLEQLDYLVDRIRQVEQEESHLWNELPMRIQLYTEAFYYIGRAPAVALREAPEFQRNWIPLQDRDDHQKCDHRTPRRPRRTSIGLFQLAT